MPASSPTDAWTQFALAVFRANAAIIDAGNDIVRPMGQTSARWQVLGRVHEPQTVAQIARDVGHARQSVQRVADKLVAEGLVTYHPHPADRRTKLLGLTEAGAEVMSAIYTRQLAWSQGVTALVEPSDLATLAHSLHAVTEIVEGVIADNRRQTTTEEKE